MFLFDYHNVFYNFLNLNDNNLYTFVRDKQNLNSDTIYFHHDYFYSPDVIDRELILNFSVYIYEGRTFLNHTLFVVSLRVSLGFFSNNLKGS